MSILNRRQLLAMAPAAAAAWVAAHAARAAQQPKILAGQIGTRHAHAAGKMATLRKLHEIYQVAGVVEPDDDRWNAVKDSESYRGLERLSGEELLAVEGLQLIAVETEVEQLVPTAARCIAAGKHVHLDKPAGESLAEFRALLAAAAERGLTVQMGYMLRYNPAFRFLFQAIADGWLGDIFEVHGVISKTVDQATRRQLARYRGGAMFELGCHLIDALVYALGKPDSVTPFIRRTKAATDSLADNQLAVFEYDKATATIRSALMEVDGFRRRQFVVCGTAGTIAIEPLEPPKLTLTLDRARGEFPRGTTEMEFPPAGGRYDGDFLDFAQIIRGEKQAEFTPAHDLAVQEALLRASGLAVS